MLTSGNSPQDADADSPPFANITISVLTAAILIALSVVCAVQNFGASGIVLMSVTTALAPLYGMVITELPATRHQLILIASLSIFLTMLSVEFAANPHCLSLCYSPHITSSSISAKQNHTSTTNRSFECVDFCMLPLRGDVSFHFSRYSIAGRAAANEKLERLAAHRTLESLAANETLKSAATNETLESATTNGMAEIAKENSTMEIQETGGREQANFGFGGQGNMA
jgi:hypothetical protein